MKRSDLYKKLRDIAKAKMPELVYVDLQKQQFKKANPEHPIPMPALLIEMRDGSFENISHLSQTGKKTISIYRYDELVTDSFDGSESENETIELLDNQDALFQAFQGESCELFSAMIRVSESIHEYGNCYVCFKTDFTVSVLDEKIIAKQKIQANTIKVKINIANGEN